MAKRSGASKGSLSAQITYLAIAAATQQRILVGMGCNQLQGFLLSHPVLEADLVRQLAFDANGQLRVGGRGRG